jgi:hypothetical protein
MPSMLPAAIDRPGWLGETAPAFAVHFSTTTPPTIEIACSVPLPL